MSRVWLFALLLCALRAAAEPVTTLVDNGDPQHRIDIAILGDGFTFVEQAAFQEHAAALAAEFFAEPPFLEYAPFFNVHAVEVLSNESGADHPEAETPEERDTALGATYNCADIERLICIDYAATEAVLERSLDIAARDLVVVLVNDTDYGGSGGAFAVSSIHDSRDEIVLHEVGHSFGLLADEYDYGTCATEEEEPPEPNVTRRTGRAEIKWNVDGGPPSGWIELDTPLPTVDETPSQPGLYEGGKYCEERVYRPTFESKMRSLDHPWDAVNEEALVKVIHQYVPLIESVRLPVDDLVLPDYGRATFAAALLRPTPDTLAVTWRLDGAVVGGTDELTLDLRDIGVGRHRLVLTVADATAKVRNDPDGILREEMHWELTIEQRRDADQDGLPDAFELANGLDPDDPADAQADADRDGLSNAAEFLAGTNLRLADSDGDGIADGEEVRDGTDPLDAADCATCRRSFVARFAAALEAADSDATERDAAAAPDGAGAGPR